MAYKRKNKKKAFQEEYNMPQMIARDSWDVKAEELKMRRDELGIQPMYIASQTPAIAKVLCERYGMTDVQLADVFGVTKSEFSGWKRTFPALYNSIQQGRDLYDGDVVEDALMKLALGYRYIEKRTEEIIIRQKSAVMVDGAKKYVDVKVPASKVTITEKEVAPDAKAIIFYLTNRKSKRWANEKKVTAAGTIKHDHTVTNVDLSKLSKQELLEYRKAVEKHRGVVEGEIIDTEGVSDSLEHILKKL